VDEAGEIVWTMVLGGSGGDGFRSAVKTGDGGYAYIGSSSSSDGDLPGNRGGTDVWVVKVGADPVGLAETTALEPVVIYPNPCSDKLHLVGTFPGAPQLRWSIIDAQGKPVDSGTTIANAPITVERLAPGAYTLLLENGTQRSAAPFVKQ
jgi:hypothetical protein